MEQDKIISEAFSILGKRSAEKRKERLKGKKYTDFFRDLSQKAKEKRLSTVGYKKD